MGDNSSDVYKNNRKYGDQIIKKKRTSLNVCIWSLVSHKSSCNSIGKNS